MTAVLADPNLAFVLLVMGMLGLYWELLAPGSVIPGFVGAILVGAGAVGLLQDQLNWYGFVGIMLAVLLIAFELKFFSHGLSGVAGAVLFAAGAIALVRGPQGISPVLAISVAVAMGLIAFFLGYLGMNARRSGLPAGLNAMVGEIGTSRTDIAPEGTVFVHGEYWRARSETRIPAGSRVLIERVQDLVLYVKGA